MGVSVKWDAPTLEQKGIRVREQGDEFQKDRDPNQTIAQGQAGVFLGVARRIRPTNPMPMCAAFLLLAAVSAFGEDAKETRRFVLYQMDSACVCINTKKETKTVSATELRLGKLAHQVAYQVFWSRTTPKRELFRVEIGGYTNGEGDQWWNYGVVDEYDFNGDGVPDYTWYGGDDTGGVMYLFLSSSNGYKPVDLLKSVEAAWRKRFNKPAPDLSDSCSDYCVNQTVLERSPSGLVLHATVHHSTLDEKDEATYRFDIVQADFKTK